MGPEPHTLTGHLLCTDSGQHITRYTIPGTSVYPSISPSMHPSIQHQNSTSAQRISWFYRVLSPLWGC